MKIIAATGNAHKLEEFRRILAPLGVEVLSLSDAGCALDVEETGETFLENAAIKARYIHERTGLAAFADDSGLCVDALGGKPGIYSARYGGDDMPHSEKIELLLDELADIPEDKRSARFTAAIFCVLEDGTELRCQESCEGRIGYEPRGAEGFGYDPIFYMGERSFAEFSGTEKDEVSHRGKALRRFAFMLECRRERGRVVELGIADGSCLDSLFSYTAETMVKSFTQGHMCRGWTDNPGNPGCGMIAGGNDLWDFCFLAGDSGGPAAKGLMAHTAPESFITPENHGWEKLIKDYWGGDARKITRYAIKKEPGVFDRERLRGFLDALPEGYAIRQIDGELYHRCMAMELTRDFCSHFRDEADFLERGLGFCVMAGDEIIGGASSFTIYTGGIEIEIGIAGEHRRKGLATAVAAKLILACLDRGWYPSWDAANKSSVGLAEKLGYHFDHEYTAYEIALSK